MAHFSYRFSASKFLTICHHGYAVTQQELGALWGRGLGDITVNPVSGTVRKRVP